MFAWWFGTRREAGRLSRDAATIASRHIAALMRDPRIEGPQACPKGLRHAFGVAARRRRHSPPHDRQHVGVTLGNGTVPGRELRHHPACPKMVCA